MGGQELTVAPFSEQVVPHMLTQKYFPLSLMAQPLWEVSWGLQPKSDWDVWFLLCTKLYGNGHMIPRSSAQGYWCACGLIKTQWRHWLYEQALSCGAYLCYHVQIQLNRFGRVHAGTPAIFVMVQFHTLVSNIAVFFLTNPYCHGMKSYFHFLPSSTFPWFVLFPYVVFDRAVILWPTWIASTMILEIFWENRLSSPSLGKKK